MAIAGVSAALAGTQLVPTPPAANALVDEANAVKVFEKTKQSIVALAEYTDGGVNGGYASKGTGVVWASFHEGGFVVTSFHVVKEFVNGAPSGGAGKEKKKRKMMAAPQKSFESTSRKQTAREAIGTTRSWLGRSARAISRCCG